MEIDLKSGLNPIKQDVKKGKLRYVSFLGAKRTLQINLSVSP